MKLLRKLSLLLAMLFVPCSAYAETSSIQSIDVQELGALMKSSNPPMLIDVREPPEYEVDGLKEAKNMPLSTFDGAMSILPKDKTIAVICRSGHRSMVASEKLAAAGYTKILNVKGGMIAWKARAQEK